MKKLSLALLLMTGIATVVFIKNNFETSHTNQNKSYALFKMYKSLEELVGESDIILEGSISSDFKERYDKAMAPPLRVYEVTISDLIHVSKNNELKRGDKIKLSIPIIYFTNEGLQVPTGDNLFFISSFERYGEKNYVLANPHYIYKLYGKTEDTGDRKIYRKYDDNCYLYEISIREVKEATAKVYGEEQD